MAVAKAQSKQLFSCALVCAGMHVRWCVWRVCVRRVCVRRVCVRRVCVRRVCGVCHHGAHLGGARVLDALLEAQLARLQLDISLYLPISPYISIYLPSPSPRSPAA